MQLIKKASSLSLIMFLVLLTVTGCHYSGKLRREFHSDLYTRSIQKIPLSVAFLREPWAEKFMVKGTSVVNISICVGKAYLDAMETELNNIFEEVKVVRSRMEVSNVDLVAKPAIQYQQYGRELSFTIEIALDLQEASSKKQIAHLKHSNRAVYTDDAETLSAAFVTGFTLFLTTPWLTSSMGRGVRKQLEQAISESVGRVCSQIPGNAGVLAYTKRLRGTTTQTGIAKEKKAPKIKIAKSLSIDVDINIPEGRHIAGEDDIAVVIANKNYNSAPRVNFAIHDGRIIKEYLVKTIGFREGNIIYKENANLGDFYTIFGKRGNPKGKLYNYVEPNSRIFIYYAGHGAPDPDSGSAFFVPVEADPQYVVNSGYSLDTLKENLGKLRAKDITIVLDCCFSGGSAKGELIKGISPAALQLKDIYAAPGNMTMLLSAKANQVSSWYPEKRHSLFTYYFLKGLQGKADKNGDKRITVTEMKTYLKNNIPRMARRLNNIDQTPVVSGKEDKVLAVLK